MTSQNSALGMRSEEMRVTPPTTLRVTNERLLDETTTRVRSAASSFARLSLEQRIALARSMQAGYLQMAEQFVRAACEAKGIPLGTSAEAEEWATGPWCIVRHLRLIAESLHALHRTGNTPIGKVARTAGGRLAVNVFPASAVDGVLYKGITVEAHMSALVGETELRDTRASFYKGGAHDGRTVLVLGAGNIAAIPAMDVITKMFNEGKTCVLKMNPVNAYLGPLFEQAFSEAIRSDFLAIVYGGAEEGTYLAHHAAIDEIHLTGSEQTYDNIVWGPAGPERDARKARNAPLVTKPVTAELGNITPVLVVPGPYTDKELAFQAESIAGGMVNNASFNCNSPKMLVTPTGWSSRQQLLAALERALGAAPVRHAYYPGAESRWQQLTRNRAHVRTIGEAAPGSLPWTLISGVDAADASDPAFQTEPFCSILSETEVGSADPIEFLERAVDFANDRLWGTLSAQLVVHPKSMKDARIGPAVERAIERLRYGMVSINSWSGICFGFASPPWGAHPGSTPADIQSGTGWVHNTSMLEGVEKVVLRHPVTIVPKPVTFPTHRTARTLMRRISYQEERGGWGKVPGVIAAAMRG